MSNNFAVFVSGYGRGAIEIINDFQLGLIQPKLNLILSSNPKSKVIEIAKAKNIPSVIIEPSNFQSREEYENGIIDELENYNINYIFLAGWMKILGETLIEKYKNRIVNIHNSLLPSFKGLNAIDQALNYGVKYTGITTHFVDTSIDGGSIIDQEIVRIDDDDNFKTLDNKVFKAGTILTLKTINKVFKK